jgi:hypothetical protein
VCVNNLQPKTRREHKLNVTNAIAANLTAKRRLYVVYSQQASLGVPNLTKKNNIHTYVHTYIQTKQQINEQTNSPPSVVFTSCSQHASLGVPAGARAVVNSPGVREEKKKGIEVLDKERKNESSVAKARQVMIDRSECD